MRITSIILLSKVLCWLIIIVNAILTTSLQLPALANKQAPNIYAFPITVVSVPISLFMWMASLGILIYCGKGYITKLEYILLHLFALASIALSVGVYFLGDARFY